MEKKCGKTVETINNYIKFTNRMMISILIKKLKLLSNIIMTFNKNLKYLLISLISLIFLNMRWAKMKTIDDSNNNF